MLGSPRHATRAPNVVKLCEAPAAMPNTPERNKVIWVTITGSLVSVMSQCRYMLVEPTFHESRRPIMSARTPCQPVQHVSQHDARRTYPCCSTHDKTDIERQSRKCDMRLVQKSNANLVSADVACRRDNLPVASPARWQEE